MKILKLTDDNATLELQYNQQSGQVYLAEAQLFITGDYDNNNKGMYFDIHNVEDITELIRWLSTIRNDMVSHYQKKPDAINPSHK